MKLRGKNVLLSFGVTVLVTAAFFTPQIAGNHKTGDLVGQIQVSDRNINTKFTFDILKGNENNLFKVDEFGNIWILSGKGVDRMAGKSIELLVRVCDNGVRSGHLHDKQVPLSVVPAQCSEGIITIKVSKIASYTRIYNKRKK